MFRGEPNDWVSFCSDTATYEIKEAETSNSLLLVKDIKSHEELKNEALEDETLAHNVTVIKPFYRYLEMKPTKPGWQKLMQLLESRVLKSYKPG